MVLALEAEVRSIMDEHGVIRCKGMLFTYLAVHIPMILAEHVRLLHLYSNPKQDGRDSVFNTGKKN